MKEYLVLEYSGRAKLDICLDFGAVAGVRTGGSSHCQGQTEDVVIAPPSRPRVHQDMNVSVQE